MMAFREALGVAGLWLVVAGCGDEAAPLQGVSPTPLAGATSRLDDALTGDSGFALGGTVVGLAGSGLTLTSLVGDLAIESEGPFAFPRRLEAGRPYDVSVKAHPNDPFQLCRVERGRGNIESADIEDVAVTCVAQPAPPGLDPRFGADGRVALAVGSNDGGMAVQADGKLVLVGASAGDFLVARVESGGRLDASFGAGGTESTDLGRGLDDRVHAVALQADGKLVVVGEAAVGLTARDQLDYDFALVRYDSDGRLDPSFGDAGRVTTDFHGERDRAFSVVIQSDGKIVVAGAAGRSAPSRDGSDFALARYEADGRLDPGFGDAGQLTTELAAGGGQARNVVLTPGGGVLLSGPVALDTDAGLAHTGLVRYDALGRLDPSFAAGGTLLLRDVRAGEALVLQGDGKIVLAGAADVADAAGATTAWALLRRNEDGSSDESFGDAGRVVSAFGSGNEVAHAVALDADGLVVAGSRTLGANTDFALARYDESGVLDLSVGDAGLLGVDYFGALDSAQHVAVLPDGQLVLAGFVQNGLVAGFGLARASSPVALKPEHQ
ncbi:MAG TPA: hypothetical protein VJU61_11060 [Polyangiaceae bacterium]|nr:hypothetical protein [Polyangiaceae bacterium]